MKHYKKKKTCVAFIMLKSKMMFIKRLVSVGLCIVIAFTLGGCSPKKHNYPETNCRLLVRGKDITDGNYVRIQYECESKYVELPFIAVLEALGVDLRWEREHPKRFWERKNIVKFSSTDKAFSGRHLGSNCEYTLYIDDLYLACDDEDGDLHGNYFDLPLMNSTPDGFSPTLKNIDGEVVVVTARLYSWFTDLGLFCVVDEEDGIVKIMDFDWVEMKFM